MRTADGFEAQDGDRVFPTFGYEAIVGTDEILPDVEYYSTPLAAKVGLLHELQNRLFGVRQQEAQLQDRITLLMSEIINARPVAQVIHFRPARMPAALTTES